MQSPVSPLGRQKKLEVAMEEEGLADEEVNTALSNFTNCFAFVPLLQMGV